MSSSPVDEKRIAGLRAELDAGGAAGVKGRPAARLALKRRIQSVVRRAIAWYVDPAAARAASTAASQVRGQLEEHERRVDGTSIAVDVEMLKAQVRALHAEVERLSSAIQDRPRTRRRKASEDRSR